MGSLSKILLSLNMILLDLAVGYLVFESLSTPPKADPVSENLTTVPEQTLDTEEKMDGEECPIGCVDYIRSILQKTSAISPTIIPTPTVAIRLPVSITSPKVRSASYLPIPGSGSTLSTSWVDVAGSDFYMSTADYPGLVGVYFEANMKLQNGNGKAYARVYDASNNRGVDGSEISTTSQTSEFVSAGPVSLWAGFNHYKIQIKTLTADTGFFETGKLKIITEN